MKTSLLWRVVLPQSIIGLAKSAYLLLAIFPLLTLSIRGQTADDYFQLGIKKLSANDLDGAISDYTNVITLKPDLANAYVYRGVAEGGKGDLDGAILDFNKAIAIKPNAPEGYHGRGDIHYNRHEFTDALTDYRKALELAPSDGDAQFRVWLIRVRLGERDPATQELKQYLDSPSAQDRDPWISKMGRLLPRQMMPGPESLKAAFDASLFQAAKDSDPNRDAWQHCEAYFYAGTVHLLNGDKDKAVEYFQEGLKINQKGLAAYQSAVAELQFLKADSTHTAESPTASHSTNSTDGAASASPANSQTLVVMDASGQPIKKVFFSSTGQPTTEVLLSPDGQANGSGPPSSAGKPVLSPEQQQQANQIDGPRATLAELSDLTPPAPEATPAHTTSTPPPTQAEVAAPPHATPIPASAPPPAPIMPPALATPATDNAEAASYRVSASGGNIEAARKLGLLYYNGKGVPKDFAEALRWLQKAADQGDAEAQDKIGNMYRNGWGETKDYGQALSWFQKAADQDYAPAQYHIGDIYFSGRGVARDEAQAQVWFKKALPGIQKAADEGDSEAQTRLGSMYASGFGIAKDDSQAVSWFQKAADQGQAQAQFNLGVMYQNGHGIPQDYTQAMTWYRKAAEQRNAEAQTNIGGMYRNGLGVPQDNAQALIWYQKGADKGVAQAQFNLGVMYEHGLGVPQDNAQAMSLYQKAADQGLAEAQTALKKANNGSSIPPSISVTDSQYDERSALTDVQLAARAGNPSAEYQLALRILNTTARSLAVAKLINDESDDYSNFVQYNDGKVGEIWVDYNGKNRRMLRLCDIDDSNVAALNLNFAMPDFAKTTLPALLSKRRALQQMIDAVNKDETQRSLSLLEDAASKDYASAFDELSLLYLYGRVIVVNKLNWVGSALQSSPGCEINPAKAFGCAQKSAALGSSWGMHNLGVDYTTGNGVAKDVAKGVEWIKKSADAGNLSSYSLLSNIYCDGGVNGHDDGYPKNCVQAYVMGRALQEVSQPNSSASQWANETVDKSRPMVSPEDLITAENRVPEEVLRLKSVAKISAPEAPKTLKASELTKSEWKAGVGKAQPLFASTGLLKMSRDEFIKLCGQPDKTETLDDKVYWYYSCTDGTIQLVLSKFPLELSGIVIVTQVNDY